MRVKRWYKVNLFPQKIVYSNEPQTLNAYVKQDHQITLLTVDK